MQFEILNTIQYLVVLILCTILMFYVKDRFIKFKYRYYLLAVLVVTGLSHTQFYTLTETQDVEQTQNIMQRQSNSISNDKTLDSYIEMKENKDSQVEVKTIETLLKEQKQRSLELANEIENKYKGNK